MQKTKCGLCGYEFEHGMKICQGCHGHIKYGAGGYKWFLGSLYAGLVWWAASYVNENWFAISEKVALFLIGGSFILGAFHASRLFKNLVEVKKKQIAD